MTPSKPKTALLFGVHGHQPVGNFESVIVEAHAKCYRPFFETLSRYPAFRFSVHFSGWLLERLLEDFPADMALVKEMVARGQVELFCSGHYEPVLSSIPMRDRLGQLEANAGFLLRHFGARPTGAWLTERVWESSIVPALCASGIRYITVDDYHFLCTGKVREEIDGYFTTEEEGEALALFPISEDLRYHLPFTPAPEVVAFLERRAEEGHRAAVYFDDIEKFGIWPQTWEWVYGKRWLESFVEGVLASERLTPMTFREFHSREPSRGVIYLPTTSYAEMNEWTLPAGRAEAYTALLARERSSGNFEVTKPFLRGGMWRNFLSLYPEANWMHKRMLGLSRRLGQAPPRAQTAELRRRLYAAQANDAYWHGLFGGLYLPHLRRAVWNSLIELEAALDARLPPEPVWRGDLDLDGVEELLLSAAGLKLALKLDGYGSIHELDARGLAHNFGDSLAKVRHAYFSKFIKPRNPESPAAGIASAHDRAVLKHDVSPQDLEPDAAPRRVLLDFLGGGDGARTAVANYVWAAPEPGRPEARFVAEGAGWQLEKRIRLAEGRLEARYRFSGAAPERLEIDLNLAMPSCDGYSGRYILDSGEIPCGFGQPLDLEGCTRLVLDDRELRGGLTVYASLPVALRARPHHTVSQSEAGLEKIMQSACVTVKWPVLRGGSELTLFLEPTLDPGRKKTGSLEPVRAHSSRWQRLGARLKRIYHRR